VVRRDLTETLLSPPVGYDAETALIVTDVQNDFASPAGSLSVEGGEDVVAVINDEIERASSEGALIVYTQDWHPPTTPHFAKDGGIWPVHCVQGTWGAEFHPALMMGGDVVRKGSGGEDGYSGFSARDPRTGVVAETTMRSLLDRRGIRRLLITGIATDYCVKETALDGVRFGFDVVVLTEAIRAVDLRPGDGERALEEVRRAGGRIVRTPTRSPQDE
jgi:nicotinamidase/pyrazinamidase